MDAHPHHRPPAPPAPATRLTARAYRERVRATLHPGWEQLLAPVSAQLDAAIAASYDQIRAGVMVLPAPDRILAAFATAPETTRVLILGQDPYPTPGHAIGLSFAVAPAVTPPRSLANIFTELSSDLGIPRPLTGNLSPWAASGVLLLNRVLTVAAGAPGSHQGLGWETVTDFAIRTLSTAGQLPVAILWGAQARALAPSLTGPTTVIESAHPSPLAARRGFFGSRPFSRANSALERAGLAPIAWGNLGDDPVGHLLTEAATAPAGDPKS